VHRTQAIAGAVGFHNATMASATVSNWWTDGGDVIAFSRGPAGQANGWIVLNAGPNSAGAREFTTGLAAGTYCDVIHGTVSAGACSGPTVVVTGDGRATLSVPAVSAVALDTASRL
jgi:alpha-amylase